MKTDRVAQRISVFFGRGETTPGATRFREALGRTPREEVIRLRILRAQELIRTTKLPLQRVAEQCGYVSYHYLARVFKKQTGMTIREYRDAWPTAHEL